MIKKWSRQYRGDPEFEFDLLAIDVGERIVERMEELGMTRTRLAAAVGVSKARISQILSGRDNLTLKSLVAVAMGLDTRIELRLKSKDTPNGTRTGAGTHGQHRDRAARKVTAPRIPPATGG